MKAVERKHFSPPFPCRVYVSRRTSRFLAPFAPRCHPAAPPHFWGTTGRRGATHGTAPAGTLLKLMSLSQSSCGTDGQTDRRMDGQQTLRLCSGSIQLHPRCSAPSSGAGAAPGSLHPLDFYFYFCWVPVAVGLLPAPQTRQPHGATPRGAGGAEPLGCPLPRRPPWFPEVPWMETQGPGVPQLPPSPMGLPKIILPSSTQHIPAPEPPPIKGGNPVCVQTP